MEVNLPIKEMKTSKWGNDIGSSRSTFYFEMINKINVLFHFLIFLLSYNICGSGIFKGTDATFLI